MENKDYPLDILLKGAGVELVNKKPASLLENYKQVIQDICKSLSEHSSKRVCQEFCVNRFNKQHRIAA